MTTAEMVDLVKQRSKLQDEVKILRELRAAYRWVARRVFMSSRGPELLSTYGEELTALVSTTREFNIGAAVTGGELLGIKTLWAKLPGDTIFTPLEPADAGSPGFMAADSAPTADPDIATGHPVFFAIINYSSARFAPALPATTVLRVDYWRLGPAPDPTTNPTATLGTDLPAIFHDAIVTKCVAQTFHNIDDEREAADEAKARDELNDALIVGDKRNQGPVQTTPFRSRRGRRWI